MTKILMSATTQTKIFATRWLFAVTSLAVTHALAQLVTMEMARKMELGAYVASMDICYHWYFL
uniref:Uncharacterized protein n=1 Tax=Vitis vinifera TaxID=29760 RepID=F6HLZ2_VITVI